MTFASSTIIIYLLYTLIYTTAAGRDNGTRAQPILKIVHALFSFSRGVGTNERERERVKKNNKQTRPLSSVWISISDSARRADREANERERERVSERASKSYTHFRAGPRPHPMIRDKMVRATIAAGCHYVT